jgi:hypothetical protein
LFTNDYIMRQIEMLVQGIALVMGLKKENRQEEAADLLTGTLTKFFGLSDKALEQLSWKSLMEVASPGYAPNMEKCALLAQLIKEKADIDGKAEGAAEASAELYAKALNMLLTAVLADDRLAGGTNAQYIEEIIELLNDRAHPQDSLQLLMQYYEATGRYGKAEDALFILLEATGNREDMVDAGTAFYKRLLLLPDERLLTGNLPRHEVSEGLRRLG